jgi:hypothetical protein
MGWAALWATFSQTHLVTLPRMHLKLKEGMVGVGGGSCGFAVQLLRTYVCI